MNGRVRFRFEKAGRYAETDPAAPQIQVENDGDEAFLTLGRAKELEELGRGAILPDEPEPEGDEPEPEGDESEPEGDESEPEGDEPEPEGDEPEPEKAKPEKKRLRRRKPR